MKAAKAATAAKQADNARRATIRDSGTTKGGSDPSTDYLEKRLTTILSDNQNS